jgi:hypothetical protein
MNEKKKYNEAKYFLEQIKINKMNRDVFEANLSAFLTSSRTIFQYALKEATNKDGGKTWYENKVSTGTIIKYLKEKRDLNIHVEPVTSQAHYSVESTLQIHVSAIATVTDKDGKVVSQTQIGTPRENSPNNETIVDVIYIFQDWPGSEDIISLCGLYLLEIEAFIKDGINQNFIAG